MLENTALSTIIGIDLNGLNNQEALHSKRFTLANQIDFANASSKLEQQDIQPLLTNEVTQNEISFFELLKQSSEQKIDQSFAKVRGLSLD